VGSARSPRVRGSAAALGVAASAPVVGRARELARFGGLVEAVAGGEGRVVVVSGEAGIGKSRLAAEVLERCRASGFGVFLGAADEVEQRRPFGVVVDTLRVGVGGDEARREIRGLLSAGAGGGGFGVESRIADLLVGVVAEASGSGPVVVVLDDLQWADESSLLAVRGLARLAGSCPLLLVCVLRGYPAGLPLRALLASLEYRGAERVDLGGLDAGEVSELAARLAGAPPGEGLARLLADAGGNPFYVSELLRCVVREDAAEVSPDGMLEPNGAGLPPSLRLTILEDLRFLPGATLEVLRAATVVGRAFSVREVALISPSSVVDVVEALGPAQRAGIVVEDGELLAFRHDLIREAVYEDLAHAVRRGLHRHLASGLEASGAGLERVAAQLMLGAEAADGEAIGWLRRAAGKVRASSPAIAADILWRALELSAGTGVPRMGVLVDLVRPLLWTGQAARTEQVCSEALESGAPADEEPLFWMGLVNSRILQGRFQEARETGDRALACASLTESDRLHLASARALSGAYQGDSEALEEARVIAATAPTSIPRGIAQEVVAQWELFTGRADRALAAYEQVDAMRAPAQLESRIWQSSGIRVRMWEAVALLDLDRIEDAVAVLEHELAGKLSVPALPHAFLAACRYHAGRFHDAIAECNAAVAAAEAAQSFIPASAPALAATIALRQGRLEDAERLTLRAEEVRTPAEFGGDTIARWTRTLLHEASGETEQAADAAGAALASYLRSGFASYLAWHAPDLVRVCISAGRPEQAELAAAAAERAAGVLPVASRRAGALRARGLLTNDPAMFEQALAAARDARRPVDLALTLRDTAAALSRNGQPKRARALATEALELLRDLGAAGEEQSTRSVLRAAGLTLSARSKHARSRDGWDSLTEAELKIVALASQGRTNPQIAQALYLSPRTVGWHLSNIFGKLGVTSRGQLTAQAVRRDLI